MIKAYYLLTKPGIVYSNALTAIAGFFLASKGNFSIAVFFSMLFGLSFVIASACVFNNYIDRGIDSKMSRTQKRPLITKKISGIHALVYATILGLCGFFLLYFYTNVLTAFVAFIGFFFYVVVYSFGKRQSEYGTLVGSISGAVPPVVGYCSVTNHLDLAAWLLFFALVAWQMPHFYAIAIFRYDDYKNASIPVLPVKNGLFQTKLQILFYVLLFICVIGMFTYFHYTGYGFLIIMEVVSLIWLGIAISGFRVLDDRRWARHMFFFSLLIIVLFSVVLSLSPFLH